MKGEVWLSSPTCNKSSCNMTVFSCRIDISIPLYQPKDFLQLPSFLGTVYMLPAASRMDIACPKYNVFHLSVWLTSFLTSCTVFKNRLGEKKKNPRHLEGSLEVLKWIIQDVPCCYLGSRKLNLRWGRQVLCPGATPQSHVYTFSLFSWEKKKEHVGDQNPQVSEKPDLSSSEQLSVSSLHGHHSLSCTSVCSSYLSWVVAMKKGTKWLSFSRARRQSQQRDSERVG